MTLSPQQLKDKLLNTLDHHYNVTDMVGAVELLSVLEKYPVTKEILEKTRIGLYVNEMRKKATNKDFAKRIKNLVRKWQLLCRPLAQTVEAVSTEPVTRVNGKGPIYSQILEGHSCLKEVDGLRPISPASRPETPCSIKSDVSSPRSTYSTPTLAASAARREGIEFASGTGVSRCASEIPFSAQSLAVSSLFHRTAAALQHHSSSSSAKLHSAPTTPMNSSNLVVTAGNARNGTDWTAPGKRKLEDESRLPGIKIKIRKKNSVCEGDAESNSSLSVTSPDIWSCAPEVTHKSGVNGFHGVHSVHPSPSASFVEASPRNGVPSEPRQGRPTNSSKTKSGFVRTSSIVSSHSAGSLSRMDSLTPGRHDLVSLPGHAPKVETTAEIIQKLHASGELRLVASNTVKNIVSNRIVKETHSDGESAIPAAAKPRPYRKNAVVPPPTTPDSMTMCQIKNEMVHKFLETSIQSIPTCDDNALNFLKRLDPPLYNDTLIELDDLTKGGRPLQNTTFNPNPTIPDGALEALPSQLPPVGSMQIDWYSLEYEAPVPSSRPRVTDDDVELLHTSQIPGINGQYDYGHNWVDWSRAYSVRSYDGELLHVLPYVNIAD